MPNGNGQNGNGATATVPVDGAEAIKSLVVRMRYAFRLLTGMEPSPENLEAHPALLQATTAVVLSQEKTKRGEAIGQRRYQNNGW